MKLKERVTFITCCGILALLIARFQSNGDDETQRTPNKLRSANDISDFERESNAHKLILQKIDDDIVLLNNNLSNNTFKKDIDQDMHPWDIWYNMVSNRSITSNETDVQKILTNMQTSKVVSAKNGYRGTQLKALLYLDGPTYQAVVFKPGRYKRDHIIEGNPYDGYDRHNGEIAAFHLDRILGFNRAPPVVGRKIDLRNELMPVAEKKILDTFYDDATGNTCFYGVCYYCTREEPACANGSVLEGSLTLWLPDMWQVKKLRHPWQRTYKENKKAEWEVHSSSYCQKVTKDAPYDDGPRLLDIMDTALFDFLIGNADRHHYEYLGNGGRNNGMLIHLDNAKSFGNPHKDEMSILAPIQQCCKFRKSTYVRLTKLFYSGEKISVKLEMSMRGDMLSPILTGEHLLAVERRFLKALQLLDDCIARVGVENVLLPDKF